LFVDKFAVAMSGMPLILKSAISTACGFAPVVNKTPGANAAPPPFKRTVTSDAPWFAATRSIVPLPSRSPAASEAGAVPVPRVIGAPRAPAPFPNNIVIVLPL
jgi:hypothetical protein